MCKFVIKTILILMILQNFKEFEIGIRNFDLVEKHYKSL